MNPYADTGFVTQQGMDHGEAIAAAGHYGFDFVELMMDGSGAADRLDREGVREGLDAEGLDLLVHLPFGGFDLGSPHDPVREGAIDGLRAHLDLAADLGARKAVVHPDSHAWGAAWDQSTIRSRIVESVRTLDAYATDLGVELCAENVPHSAFRTHEFDRLFEETAASMTLDTGHARMDGRDAGGIASFVEDHADRISHVHLNDTRGTRDEHLPFGAGTIDFERVFDAFPPDWDGTLSLEVYTLNYDYVDASGRQLRELL
jgi:sugar phosphate isomerase/epimerase